MAKIIYANGQELTCHPKDKEAGFSCEELYFLLSCSTIEMQEIKQTDDGNLMILDEEGKLSDKPMNEKGTRLWEESHGLPVAQLLMNGDHIVGDILICTDAEFK